MKNAMVTPQEAVKADLSLSYFQNLQNQLLRRCRIGKVALKQSHSG